MVLRASNGVIVHFYDRFPDRIRNAVKCPFHLGGDTGWYDHAGCCVDRFLSGDLLILVNDLFVPLRYLECRCFCVE